MNVNRQETGAVNMENEKLTLTVSETARILGIGRNSAYGAISRGEIPVIRVGKRLLVPKAALETMLGCTRTKASEPTNEPQKDHN